MVQRIHIESCEQKNTSLLRRVFYCVFKSLVSQETYAFFSFQINIHELIFFKKQNKKCREFNTCNYNQTSKENPLCDCAKFSVFKRILDNKLK